MVVVLAGLFGGPQSPLDVAAIHRLTDIRHQLPRFTSMVVVLTQFGSVYATLGLGLAGSAWLFRSNQRPRALLLLATVIGERLIVDGLKLILGRPRPSFDVHPVVTNSSSFPSGHSANSMAVFVALALIVAPPRHRRAALAAAVFVSLLVGMSRPFLGVHWPTDVIAGWALGLLIAGIAVDAGKRSAILEREPQHDVVGRHRPAVGENEIA